MVDTAQRMVKGANALDIPVIVTEQYPKALGNTVEELKGVLKDDALIQDKLDFTMFGECLRLPAFLKSWAHNSLVSSSWFLILVSSRPLWIAVHLYFEQPIDMAF